MDGYNYDRLSPLDQSQDIADSATNPSGEPGNASRETLRSLPPSYSQLSQQDPADRNSLRSFDTFGSSSSSGSSGIEKLKQGLNRIRRKPVPNYLRGSIRKHPAAEIRPTRIGRGVWKDQLLVDRSLRSMTALTACFAIAMVVVIIMYMKPFVNRSNKETTSVGGSTRSCKQVTHTNTALLLLINVAATMTLGMSNTYQQLVTSLRVGDLRHMLQKFGDSRVGTNSPFSINHKQEGKKRSWAAWLLLISTSMPIHFLANSLIGPSYIIAPPTNVVYNSSMTWDPYSYTASAYDVSIRDGQSFLCWSAFRTGEAHLAKTGLVLAEDAQMYGADANEFGTFYSTIQVRYSESNCSSFANTARNVDELETSYVKDSPYSNYWRYQEGECAMGTHVHCLLQDPEPAKCRLNVRMQAAFILAGCLLIKAIYMAAVNLLARGKLKRQLLTFGDVIVASATNPELRVQGECMVNASESYRRLNSHTCHKHCKNPEESKTGDEIGHCQKCKKWNSSDRLSHQPQPTIATKIKRSLISNLGNTALTQMCLLMFCSLFLVGASIAMAVPLGISYHAIQEGCLEYDMDPICHLSSLDRFEQLSGGWGGFNRSKTLASLPPDQIENEIISFCVSNGAQFIYSLLYLMMIYNITLVSQEHDWGKLEHERTPIRCTIVKGECFSQDYLLQLPKKILFPIMAYSVLTHWMLGEALQTQEAIWLEERPDRYVEHSKYIITYAAYPLWIATFLILLMTGVCWWAFTYKREGFIPQMFGSIRTICAATTQLDDFPTSGIQWGDLGARRDWRHAGLSAEAVQKIVPNELYAGGASDDEEAEEERDASKISTSRQGGGTLLRKRHMESDGNVG